MEALPAAALAVEKTAFTDHLQPLLLRSYCQHALNLTAEKADEVVSQAVEWSDERAANPEKEVVVADPDLRCNVLSCVEVVRIVSEHIFGEGTQKPLEGINDIYLYFLFPIMTCQAVESVWVCK